NKNLIYQQIMPISQGNQAKKKMAGNKLPKKRDRKSYSAQRYQAKKQEYHERYLKKKTEKEQQEKENNAQLYEADSIQVLMSLKEYTELNQTKQKL
ncbi:18694_t:CDS:1, partial [Entrophospora sp. SA101]